MPTSISTRNAPGAAVQFVTVDETHAGQRLDNFLLGRLKGVPRERVYRIVRKGEVRINKGRASPDYRLQTGDVVRIPPVRMSTVAAPFGDKTDLAWLEACVLFEDEALIVLDKPSGLAVHGGSGVSLGLIEAMRQRRPALRFLELAHRLDRDTSGVILLAKKRAALLGLHEQLRGDGMDKRYLALTRGEWRARGQMIEAPLKKNELSSGERFVRVQADGKAARSQVTTREIVAGTSLVEIALLTGRTHQARAHCTYAGHPIAGDEKYGDATFNTELRAAGLRRLFLHAWRVELSHPVTAQTLSFEAPVPRELTQVLDNLRSHAPV